MTRIAVALGVGPSFFFPEANSELKCVLVKKNQRRTIVGRGSKLGHTYQSLAFGLPFPKDFEPYMMIIEERSIDPKQNEFCHPGHELLFILHGSINYRHDNNVYPLEVGDSLFFDGNFIHGPVSVNDPPVRFLSIISNSPGGFHKKTGSS